MAGVKRAARPRASGRKAAGRADGQNPSDAGASAGKRAVDPGNRPIEESDDARAERIRTLKAQIAAGTYNPDPHEIARKLLENGF